MTTATTKVCPICGKELDTICFNITHRYKGREYRDTICRDCRREVNRVKRDKPRPRRKPSTVYDCRLCWLYPCFQGMEHISSNLAETCVKYKIKQTT